MRGTIIVRMPEESVRGVATGEPAAVGTVAPEFELPALIAGVKKPLRLSSYCGTCVVLAFYPYNWQEATARLLMNFQAQRPRLLASNTESIAITVESIMNTTAWEREIGPFDFPICADFWLHGDVCRRYGVLRESGPGAGASERAVFLIDRAGQVIFRKIYGWEETPSIEEFLSVLEKL